MTANLCDGAVARISSALHEHFGYAADDLRTGYLLEIVASNRWF
jgi:hypothetical protein